MFVLDGVLIGAGDGRWLAGAGLVMLVAFLPAAWLVLDRDLGVVGLWWALTWFMVVRGALLGLARARRPLAAHERRCRGHGVRRARRCRRMSG